MVEPSKKDKNSNAIQPAGQPGVAYIGSIPATMTYEQRVQMSMQMLKQLRELHKRQLKENFPSKVAIVFSILVFLVCLALIALQIYLITAANTNDAYAGFWGGFLGICYGIVLLVIAKWSNTSTYYLFIVASIVLIAVFSSVMALNIYLLLSSTSASSSTPSVIIAMIILAAIGAILVMTCLVTIVCLLHNLKRLSKTNAEAPLTTDTSRQHKMTILDQK